MARSRRSEAGPRHRAVVVAVPRDDRGRPDDAGRAAARAVARVLSAAGHRVAGLGLGAALPDAGAIARAIGRAARGASAGDVLVVYLAAPASRRRGRTVLDAAGGGLPLDAIVAQLCQTEAATVLLLDLGRATAQVDPGHALSPADRDERDGGFALLAVDGDPARAALVAALGGEAGDDAGAVGFAAVAEQVQGAATAGAPVVRLEIAEPRVIPPVVSRALAPAPAAIRAAAYAPDGARLALADDSGVVRIVDARSGAVIATSPRHPSAIVGVGFTGRGRGPCLVGADGAVVDWARARGATETAPRRSLAVPPHRIAWRRDGRHLAATFSQVTLDPRAGFAPDAVVDLDDPAVRARLDASLVFRSGLVVRAGGRDRELAADAHKPLVCAFAGEVLVSGGGDGRLMRWDLRRGTSRALAQLPGPVWALAASPDGRWLAAGGVVVEPAADQRYDIEVVAIGGRARPRLRGHRAPITALAFAPDGRRLASASRDGEVRVWDAGLGAQLRRVRCAGGAVAAAPTVVAWSPDGASLVVGDDDGRAQLLAVGR